MFRLPSVRKRMTEAERVLAEKRLTLWVEACGLEKNPASHHRVCSRHFVNGRPAKSFETEDVDWVPTQNLSDEETSAEPDMTIEQEDETENGTETVPDDQNHHHSESFGCCVDQPNLVIENAMSESEVQMDQFRETNLDVNQSNAESSFKSIDSGCVECDESFANQFEDSTLITNSTLMCRCVLQKMSLDILKATVPKISKPKSLKRSTLYERGPYIRGGKRKAVQIPTVSALKSSFILVRMPVEKSNILDFVEQFLNKYSSLMH